jgi:hypothetical protein
MAENVVVSIVAAAGNGNSQVMLLACGMPAFTVRLTKIPAPRGSSKSSVYHAPFQY